MPLVPLVVSRGQWQGSGSYWVSGGADVETYPGSLTMDRSISYCRGPERLIDTQFPETHSGAMYIWRLSYDVNYGSCILGRESGSGWYDTDSDDGENGVNYKLIDISEHPSSSDVYIDYIGYYYAVVEIVSSDTNYDHEVWAITNRNMIVQTGSFNEGSGITPPQVTSDTPFFVGYGKLPQLCGKAI